MLRSVFCYCENHGRCDGGVFGGCGGFVLAVQHCDVEISQEET
jgi:hypothetical protein